MTAGSRNGASMADCMCCKEAMDGWDPPIGPNLPCGPGMDEIETEDEQATRDHDEATRNPDPATRHHADDAHGAGDPKRVSKRVRLGITQIARTSGTLQAHSRPKHRSIHYKFLMLPTVRR